MGFMDKVKAQATVLAEKAQEGAKAGQEKLSSMQAKRQSDAMLLEIGGLVYSQRVGRAGGDADSKIDALVTRLRDFESANGEIQVTPADGHVGATGSFVPGSASGAGGAASSQPSEPASTPPGGGMPAPPPSSGGIPTASYASDTEEQES